MTRPLRIIAALVFLLTPVAIAQSTWTARWLAATPDGDPIALPIFRREFSIVKPVQRATVYVSGLGQYELTVNGNNVTHSVLNPGSTDYRKTILYQAYDLTGLLKPGANTFGVMLGNGMYNVPPTPGRYTKFTGSFGQPKFILQLEIVYTDRSAETVVSDGRWKTLAGPITFSSIYGGEDFDARHDPVGWKLSGFDASRWSAAVEVAGPGGQLMLQTAPAVHVAQTFTPLRMTEPKPGVRVYDLGQNFSGWPAITVRGHAGDTVKLIPGELLDAHGLVSQRSADAYPSDPVLFTYTLGSHQTETWHPQFSYYGFRYVQVEAMSGSPTVESLAGEFLHDDVTTTGHFTSGLPLFNRIHGLIDNAILSNLMSVLTDCPTREKLGWLEQTHLMATSIMDNYGVARLYDKISADMADSQLANGLVPSIAPEFVAFVDGSGKNTDFRDSPEWGSAVILSPWAAYQFYGDRGILQRHYGTMTRYATYLRARTQDHILAYGLGDWYDIGPKSPGYSQLTSPGVTATAIYFQDLQTLAQIATILHHDTDAVAYRVEAEAVRDAFNERFFHPLLNQYDRDSQTANAMTLALGIVPKANRAGVLASLIEDIRAHHNHVTAGDIGFHYLVRALTDNDRSDVLVDLLTQTDAPSYGAQLAAGATTLTEAWDANPNSSQNHFMLGHAEEWFYRGLGGIDIDMSRAGAGRIVIRPAMLPQAKSASTTIHSVLGTVHTAWAFQGEAWTLDVDLPAGVQASLYLPHAVGPKVIGGGHHRYTGKP